MSQQTIQTVIAVIGTLAGVFVAHLLLARADARRLEAEDERRWHADRFRVVSDLQALCNRVDRRLADGVNSMQDFRDGRSGDEPDLDALGEWVEEQLDDAYRIYSTLELLVVGPVLDHAIAMINELGQGWHRLEARVGYDDIWEPIIAARKQRQAMIREARSILTPSD